MSTFADLEARVAEDPVIQKRYRQRLRDAETTGNYVQIVGEMAEALGLDLDSAAIRQGLEAAGAELSDEEMDDIAGGGGRSAYPEFKLYSVKISSYEVSGS